MKTFLTFDDITFTYPAIEGDLDENGKQIVPSPIFQHFSANLPGGFISLVGPNGSGKSTFLMLAAGRLKPESGRVLVSGEDIFSLPEEQKNLVASVIYQNMEFETEEKVALLLDFVFKNGALKGKGDLLKTCIKKFELDSVLEKSLTKISKGELQRVLLAFSLLYGSASVFMDEPMFAMEPYQKETALAFLRDYCKETGTTIYISMHELDLTRKYAENVMLFYPNRNIDFGTSEEVLTREDLEKAYGVPESILKEGEVLTRKNLTETAEEIAKMPK